MRLIWPLATRIRGSRTGRSTREFNYITKTGAKAMSLFGPKHQAAKQSGQGLLLTEDELAAIRVFSAGDYKYMNPVQAGSESRLVGQIKNLSQTERNETSWASDATRTLTTSGVLDRAHTRQLKVEALQHVRQAMTGLNKLPDFAGTLFRGLRVPATDLQREYQQGCIVSFPSLTSTSKDRSVSNPWAQTPIADTTGILLVLSGVTQGKDIANISMNEVEKEVLLLGRLPLPRDRGAHSAFLQRRLGGQVHAGRRRQHPDRSVDPAGTDDGCHRVDGEHILVELELIERHGHDGQHVLVELELIECDRHDGEHARDDEPDCRSAAGSDARGVAVVHVGCVDCVDRVDRVKHRHDGHDADHRSAAADGGHGHDSDDADHRSTAAGEAARSK